MFEARWITKLWKTPKSIWERHGLFLLPHATYDDLSISITCYGGLMCGTESTVQSPWYRVRWYRVHCTESKGNGIDEWKPDAKNSLLVIKFWQKCPWEDVCNPHLSKVTQFFCEHKCLDFGYDQPVNSHKRSALKHQCRVTAVPYKYL